MANIILFDSEVRENLLPLTYTRPAGEIRVGILTIREKWEKWMKAKVSFITQDFLAEKYAIDYGKENFIINGSAMPSPQLCKLIKQMEFGDAFLLGDELIAAKMDERQFERLIHDQDIGELNGIDLENTAFLKINNLWDIYQLNDQALRDDFELITKGRKSEPISDTNQVLGKENVFVEKGAKIECAVINATNGPVYIGKDAEIMEGALIRGSFAMGEGSVVKMGAKIYGATTIGPYCKLAGEINNSILLGYSNKGHEGYLGNSVIGEWCNLGAGTNVSNLKNNYSEVRLWSYPDQRFVNTGTQFCGLIMGDHSKTAIDTTFNTGTVVGISTNIFGPGFPRNFVPSFAWGGHQKFSTYPADKAFSTMEKVMDRRKVNFPVSERLIMLRLFEDTAEFRRWEKE
jgi:UDP-N-acetylglucosamine diphosphorylase/glucosamine-1-phosphate N-acetyltransferase